MDEERLTRAESIFQSAADLPPAERVFLLSERCGEDSGLRSLVERLLARHDEGGFLEPHPHATRTKTEEPPAQAESQRIGPYTLQERIGAGGMGEVWKAEQTSPVRRTVALKLIKPGMDSGQVLARFEAERQALALMDHPYIAKIFDAGITDRGRPYFVMEHVPGVPITDYCDTRQLDTRERLELFERICEGVQHAHQKAVIHRDIKPTNVLVADVDGRPMPKIIDFGVAKATTQKLTEETMYTALGELIGTPEYMSPEQADLTGEDVDTRTDVYSLGVVLYELLVGALPFDSDELRKAGFEGMLKTLREREPPRPSTKLSTLGEKTTEIAERRRTEPRRLAGQLKGDLDWIVMRSLEKDRNRRYGSPRELAQDVRRHLRHEPVLAGPPSATYRTGKFVRRHRIGVGIGTGAVLALIGVAATLGVLREQAEEARAEAQARAAELEVVTDFQASMLSEVDPALMGQALRGDVRTRVRESLEGDGVTEVEVASSLATVDDILRRANPTDLAVDLLDDQVLDQAARAVEREFAGQPLVRAALQQTLADTYVGIGRYERALPLQEAALETRRDGLGDVHEDTLYSLARMGSLHRTEGEFEKALACLEEAIEGSRRVLGNDHPQTLMAIRDMGLLCGYMGDEEKRLAYFREALEGSRRVFGDDDPRTLTAVHSMGISLMEGGRGPQALPYFREAWEGRRRVLGDDHPATLHSLVKLGAMLAGVGGRPAEGLEYAREALEGLRRVLGDDHPLTITAFGNYGSALKWVNGPDEALPYLIQRIEGHRRVYGEEAPATLRGLANLGVLLMGMGRFEEALPYVRDALEGRKKILGDEHYLTLVSVTSMCSLQLQMGNVEEARALLESREPVMREVLAAHPDYLGGYLNALGRSRVATGELESGESVLLEAEAMIMRPLARRRVLTELVRLYEAWEAVEPGEGHGRRAAEWRVKLESLEVETRMFTAE